VIVILEASAATMAVKRIVLNQVRLGVG